MMNAVRSAIGGDTIGDHERKPSQHEKPCCYLAARSSLCDTPPESCIATSRSGKRVTHSEGKRVNVTALFSCLNAALAVYGFWKRQVKYQFQSQTQRDLPLLPLHLPGRTAGVHFLSAHCWRLLLV